MDSSLEDRGPLVVFIGSGAEPVALNLAPWIAPPQLTVVIGGSHSAEARKWTGHYAVGLPDTTPIGYTQFRTAMAVPGPLWPYPVADIPGGPQPEAWLRAIAEGRPHGRTVFACHVFERNNPERVLTDHVRTAVAVADLVVVCVSLASVAEQRTRDLVEQAAAVASRERLTLIGLRDLDEGASNVDPAAFGVDVAGLWADDPRARARCNAALDVTYPQMGVLASAVYQRVGRAVADISVRPKFGLREWLGRLR